MKKKILKIVMYILQIVLTALASAGIALLQSYVQAHGVDMGVTLNPESTGAIGGTVASGRIAWSNFKNNSFL